MRTHRLPSREIRRRTLTWVKLCFDACVWKNASAWHNSPPTWNMLNQSLMRILVPHRYSAQVSKKSGMLLGGRTGGTGSQIALVIVWSQGSSPPILLTPPVIGATRALTRSRPSPATPSSTSHAFSKSIRRARGTLPMRLSLSWKSVCERHAKSLIHSG